jgi:hypothetical protein
MADIDTGTCAVPPTAGQLSETIGALFAMITTQLLYQGRYAALAFDSCAGNDVECEAMVSALIGNHDATFEKIVVNLQDCVNLLIGRINELEVSHA